jgi:hypothetical protein
MKLKKGDSVKTMTGEATIVFYEGEITHLESNTEVTIDQLSNRKVELSQAAGETWNKVTKISGISEYRLETPNTVATVRGTEFFFNDESLAVTDGEVGYGAKKGALTVRKGKRAFAERLVEEDIPQEELARFQKFPEKYEKILKRVREREIRKHKAVLKMAADRGFTEDKMRNMLNEMDEGRQDEDKAYSQIPSIFKPRSKRAYMLTKEIKRARARMQQ